MSWFSKAVKFAFKKGPQELGKALRKVGPDWMDAWIVDPLFESNAELLRTKYTTGREAAKSKARATELAALRAIGPAPSERGDLGLETLSGETPEQRKRRLRRLALVMNRGTDPYGELTLGAKGLLAR